MPKPRKSYALWLMGHALHLLFVLLIFSVCALICWRVFISAIPPSEMKRLSPNAKLAEAYRTYGEDLTLYTQEQASVTKDDANYGYFGVTRCVFIPDAEQVQVTFRYNNSTLRHVMEDYALVEEPPRGVEIFDVSIVKVVDATPEDTGDNVDGSENLVKTRIAPSDRKIDTTALYTYILYTFDDVDMTDDTITAYFDIYYSQDVNYDKDAYGTLRLYHRDNARLPVKLSGKEEKALQNYGK